MDDMGGKCPNLSFCLLSLDIIKQYHLSKSVILPNMDMIANVILILYNISINNKYSNKQSFQ